MSLHNYYVLEIEAENIILSFTSTDCIGGTELSIEWDPRKQSSLSSNWEYCIHEWVAWLRNEHNETLPLDQHTFLGKKGPQILGFNFRFSDPKM